MKITIDLIGAMQCVEENMWYCPELDDYIDTSERCKLMRNVQKRMSNNELKGQNYWITINPKPDADLKVFMKLLENFVKRKPVLNYQYNIEQRGETEADVGKGFHSHLLITWAKNQNKYIRQFCNTTFKRVVGYPNENVINIRRITDDIYNDKVAYLRGDKWDAEKDTKIKYDLIFRNKNNILDIYKHGSLQEDIQTTQTVRQEINESIADEEASSEHSEN
nr:replication-associated protein [Tick-associated circular DNA virus]